MTRPEITRERLIFVFFLGVILFNPPLLAIFDLPENWLGIPVLFVFLFAAWFALIIVMALVIETAAQEKPSEPEQEASQD